MNSKVLLMLFTFFITIASCAGETLDGTCSLIYEKKDPKSVHVVKFGEMVKGKCKFYVTDFFGASSIIANGEFENTSDKRMNFSYYVAFFDKSNKMLGVGAFRCVGKYGAIGAKQKTNVSSCIITIPDDLRDQVSNYRVTFYESEYLEEVKK